MMTNIIAFSAIATAVATIVIACLAIANTLLSKRTLNLTESIHELNKSIEENATRHQEDIKKLQIDLAAAQLYGATNPQGKALSTDRFKEYRKIVTNDL